MGSALSEVSCLPTLLRDDVADLNAQEVQTPKGNIVISVAMMVASLCTFIFAALYV